MLIILSTKLPQKEAIFCQKTNNNLIASLQNTINFTPPFTAKKHTTHPKPFPKNKLIPPTKKLINTLYTLAFRPQFAAKGGGCVGVFGGPCAAGVSGSGFWLHFGISPYWPAFGWLVVAMAGWWLVGWLPCICVLLHG